MDTTQWISWYYQSVNQYLMLYVGYLLALVGVSALLWRRANNPSARGVFWASLPSAVLFAATAGLQECHGALLRHGALVVGVAGERER